MATDPVPGLTMGKTALTHTGRNLHVHVSHSYKGWKQKLQVQDHKMIGENVISSVFFLCDGTLLRIYWTIFSQFR